MGTKIKNWKRVGKHKWVNKITKLSITIRKSILGGYVVAGQMPNYPSFDFYDITYGERFMKIKEGIKCTIDYMKRHPEG